MTHEQAKAEVKDILNECQLKLSNVIGKPVNIMYRIKVNDINAQLIIQTVCAVMNLSYSQLISKSQEQQLVVGRNLVMWLTQYYCGLTAAKIADLVNRDRTTVTHSVIKVNEMLDVADPLYMLPIQKIEKIILNITNEAA